MASMVWEWNHLTQRYLFSWCMAFFIAGRAVSLFLTDRNMNFPICNFKCLLSGFPLVLVLETVSAEFPHPFSLICFLLRFQTACLPVWRTNLDADPTQLHAQPAPSFPLWKCGGKRKKDMVCLRVQYLWTQSPEYFLFYSLTECVSVELRLNIWIVICSISVFLLTV